MKEPIIAFKDEEQLKEYGKMWQDILYLNDWIIKYILVDNIDNDSLGNNKNVFIHKTALIKILKNISNDEFITPCAEKVLIHELLHCKFEVENERPQIEDLLYEETQHQDLEFMARSLLRAKYNLSKEWFKNWSDE